jgi:exodeoxyribonuclease VII small subunit
MNNQNLKYKEALTRIEAIVNKIESNEPDVDELNDLVQEALSLLKQCKEKLKNTETELNKTLKEID